ncbi:phage tail tube protein [Ramlibacter sp. Leaf400]|uniref:phage tail tube protein n=1 Tax=Ramlibacter sp. Leaf400 TaxID=1736365 RepID=UPI0006F7FAC7|nr:phage tail tube protein [Ramlibacter sp. Leaf400]KQT10965.1 hypothetical protein ASG30_09205 [Ramlibacter sp. Leaf400]
MADRLDRDAIILSKEESSYNTDSTPTAGSDALQVSGFTLDPLNAQNDKRELLRGFLGGFEELVGDRHIAAQYSVELVGSGSAGTAPAWGAQLKACGFAETLSATTRADYTLVSGSMGSLTSYYHDSGVKHLSTGVRGNVVFDFPLGKRPMMEFSMLGIHNNESAAANPTGTFTAFKTPEAVTNANSGDITLGCTHSSSGAPALVGGLAYPSQGIRINIGNVAEHSALLGGESIVIQDREVTGTITIDATAAQEVQLLSDIRAATLTSIGFVHGTVTARKALVFMPYCQFVRERKINYKGKRMVQIDFRAIPSAGNDEFRLVTSF